MSTQQHFNALEAPFREIMNLNLKAIQSFSYIKPIELINANKPEQLMDKNVGMLIENGHKALDYMQNMFDIMGKHWAFMSREISIQSQEETKKNIKKYQKKISEGIIIPAKLTERGSTPLNDKKRPAGTSSTQVKPKTPIVGKKASATHKKTQGMSALTKENRQVSDKSLITR